MTTLENNIPLINPPRPSVKYRWTSVTYHIFFYNLHCRTPSVRRIQRLVGKIQDDHCEWANKNLHLQICWVLIRSSKHYWRQSAIVKLIYTFKSQENWQENKSNRLTSDRIRLALRAMLQVSWGCTDWRCGRSCGVYSLSLVSLVKVAF